MKLRFLFLLLFLMACDGLGLKKVDSTVLLEEELKSINWNSVDEYPSFKVCDSLVDQSSERCFKSVLINHINATLAETNIIVSEDLEDTIMLRLQISHQGQISIPEIKAKSKTRKAITNLDSLMRSCMKDLPKVYPAIKRGQHVSTEFQLPVVIRVK